MKNLAKSQKVLIVIFSACTLLLAGYIFCEILLFVTQTVPYYHEYEEFLPDVDSAILSQFFKIPLRILMLLVQYCIGVWLGILKYRNSKKLSNTKVVVPIISVQALNNIVLYIYFSVEFFTNSLPIINAFNSGNQDKAVFLSIVLFQIVAMLIFTIYFVIDIWLWIDRIKAKKR